MSLLRTPRGAGVKTCRQLKVEDEALKVGTEVKVASEMLKSECSRSTRTSSAARRLTIEAARKRAEIEIEAIEAAAEAAAKAAAKKAAIRKSLIDMELNADLAELGSERSVMSSSEKVEAWLDTTHVEATRREENATCTAPQQRTDIQELAAALTGAISNAAATNLNDQLLSRLATSKDLPIYYGDPLDWLQFRNAYYESTAVCKYTYTENMWRLRKCLRGEAKDAVSSLLIDCTSPNEIIDMLELRFGRPEIVMNKIVAQLRKLQPLSLNYHTELVQFAVKIRNHVAAARAIKQREYLQSPELVSLIVSKLPTLLVTKWADYAYTNSEVNEKPKLECLSDFLYLEAQKVAAAGVSFVQNQSEPRRKPEYTRNTHNNVLVFTNDEHNSDKCKFCKTQKHSLEQCLKFKRALRKDRWRFARTQKLCFKCLKPLHADTTCTAPECDVDGCGLGHHRLLHWSKPRPQQQTTAERDQQRLSESETVNHTALECKNVPQVLLKIVPVTVFGPKGSMHTHALLDDGSTVTLIASRLADEVGLHGVPHTMRARGAWDSNELTCETEIVNFEIANM